jgi:hypothetical protein
LQRRDAPDEIEAVALGCRHKPVELTQLAAARGELAALVQRVVVYGPEEVRQGVADRQRVEALALAGEQHVGAGDLLLALEHVCQCVAERRA